MTEGLVSKRREIQKNRRERKKNSRIREIHIVRIMQVIDIHNESVVVRHMLEEKKKKRNLPVFSLRESMHILNNVKNVKLAKEKDFFF